MNPDRLDLAILAQLQQNARLSNNELAEKVGLSPSPCWRRVKRLEEQGVITGYVALLNPEYTGTPIMAYAHISLTDHRPKSITEFDIFVQDCAQILECSSLSGQYDYLLKIVSRTMSEYEHFISSELLHLPGVQSVNTSFVLDQKKYTTALPLASE
jgi:DNA-binding Lrp family transcriptional regulator